jgi:hypothetical protein
MITTAQLSKTYPTRQEVLLIEHLFQMVHSWVAASEPPYPPTAVRVTPLVLRLIRLHMMDDPRDEATLDEEPVAPVWPDLLDQVAGLLVCNRVTAAAILRSLEGRGMVSMAWESNAPRKRGRATAGRSSEGPKPRVYDQAYDRVNRISLLGRGIQEYDAMRQVCGLSKARKGKPVQVSVSGHFLEFKAVGSKSGHSRGQVNPPQPRQPKSPKPLVVSLVPPEPVTESDGSAELIRWASHP